MKKNLIYWILVIIILSGCIKEDYFGYSKYGNIKAIEVSNQASQAVINISEKTVSIELPGGVDRSMLEIKVLQLSSFAKSDKKVGDKLNLTHKASIKITAENGEITVWQIIPFVASSTPPLQNGDFSLWYKTNEGYYEPGKDATTTIWGTGNPGTQILNLLATTRMEIESGNYAVKMETLDNGPIAGAFGTPISAGSVFVGKFDKDKIDPTDPQAAIDFGTPFVGRPEKIKFKYQYSPGAENKDRDGNTLSFGDQCDIYGYLEIRTSNDTRRLATAWFRDGNSVESLKEITLEFIYGELDNSYPDYMKPENGKYVRADSASFVLPTHFTFVASSSFDGANFAGAIGSTLVLDDVEFIYREE